MQSLHVANVRYRIFLHAERYCVVRNMAIKRKRSFTERDLFVPLWLSVIHVTFQYQISPPGSLQHKCCSWHLLLCPVDIWEFDSLRVHRVHQALRFSQTTSPWTPQGITASAYSKGEPFLRIYPSSQKQDNKLMRGTIRTVTARNGAPRARPVVALACVSRSWGGSPTFQRACL